MGRKQGRGGGRQLKKQKLPPEVSAARIPLSVLGNSRSQHSW